MNYTGRLYTSAISALVGLFWAIYHGYLVDHDFTVYIWFTVLLLPVFWLLGKQYDRAKSVTKQLEHKQRQLEDMNEELQTYKDRLNDMLESLPVVIWSINKYKNATYCSPGAEKILGVTSQLLTDEPQLWRKLIHPEDQSLMLEKEAELTLGKAVTVEYRIMQPNGTVRWLHNRINPILDNKGRLVRMNGLAVDVTERRYADERLKNSEKKYRILQNRLEQFSSKSFKIMQVADLEQLIESEVRETFNENDVALIETDGKGHWRVINDKDNVPVEVKGILNMQAMELNPGELVRFEGKCLAKISHVKNKSYWLYLDDPCPQFQSTPEYLWLITLSRYVSILFENLLIIEGLSEEIEQHVSSQETQPWLEKLLFKLSENERKRLSADLHHGALQEQIVWYRKLQMLSSDSSIPQHVRQSIDEILEGLLDVIYQIRITCTELRPAMLQEFGLVSSLEYLFEQAQLRSDFSVEFDCTEWKQAALNDEYYITLYRIVQELLTNADKHSYASRVNIKLSNGGKNINLYYSDNGIGANIEKINHATEHLGITGIRHRVISLNGNIELKSEAGQGLEYYISIPLNRNES